MNEISKERLEEISKYNSGDMELINFKDESKLKDLYDILVYHPSSIIRHEASFIIAELGQNGNKIMVEELIFAAKFDRSIVAKHEAIESLGRLTNKEDIFNSYKFLIELENNDDINFNHPDIKQTIKESIEMIKRKL